MYRTREGTLKPGKITGRNVDGTYRLSTGVAAASADRLRPLDVPSGAAPGLAVRSNTERPPLAVGTTVEYQRASGTARRSVIVGVNPDGTYRLRVRRPGAAGR
jgi:hypothetical protein